MAAPLPNDPAPASPSVAMTLPPGLNGKQYRFALHFREHRNSSKAARQAGYSEATAYAIGYELLRKPEIAKLIAELDREHLAQLHVSAQRVLGELAAVGFSDMRHFMEFDAQGNATVNFQNMPEEATRAIAELRQDRFVRGRGAAQVVVTRTRIKLHPKAPALATLAKHLGLLLQVDAGRRGTPITTTPSALEERTPPDRTALMRELEARFAEIHERERQAKTLLGETTEPAE